MPQVEEAGFSCSACGRQYRWKPELAGKSVKCKCGSPVKVPRAAGAPVAASVPPPPPPPKKVAKVVDENDADFDALAALAEQEAAVSEDAMNANDAAFCPNCRSRLPSADAVLCTSCGFDKRKGKVAVAVAKVEKPKKSMFGGGSSKPGKKKVVDALAPQGSFWIGAVTSFGMALGASIVYALLVWLIMRFLGYRVGNAVSALTVGLIGIGAGVGMQIGQKGYSTLGGFVAAGITFVVMIGARLLIIVLFGMSLLSGLGSHSSGDDEIEAPDPDARLDGHVEVKSAKDAVIEMAAKEQERRRLQREQWDREAKARGDVPKPQDPRVLQFLREKFFKDNGWDPNFSNGDQHQAAHNVAETWASTMPSEEKNKIIAMMDMRLKKERDREHLISLGVEEELSKVSEAARGSLTQLNATHDAVRNRVDKMQPDEQAMETVRLETWAKEHRSAEKKKELEEEAKEEAEEKAAEAKEKQAEAGAASKPAAAATSNDGLDDGEATPPATNRAQPTVAAKPAADSDGLGDESSAESEGAAKPPAANGNNTAVGQAAAVTGTKELQKHAKKHKASSDSSDDAEADSGDSDGSGAAGFILVAVIYVVFVGSIWNLICMISAIFLAYRTAAGSVGG